MPPEVQTNPGPSPTGTDLEDGQVKYLLFALGEELYGTQLVSIREVIKLSNIKPVPFMVPYFRGVINLRGQIVSVIDLRLRFGLKHSAGSGLILVVEHKEGLIGTIIDELVSVETFNQSDIEKNPALETKIPPEYMVGIGRTRDRLVNLIDLARCVSSEELRTVTNRS